MLSLLIAIVLVVPWYLFPGNAVSQPVASEPETAGAPSDSVDLVDDNPLTVIEETVVPDTIKISLILPFHASAESEGSMTDFYMGALLAAKSLGEEGLKLSLRPFDIASAMPDSSFLRESDMIIGPVSSADIAKTLAISPSGIHLISPLDHNVEALLDSASIIQIPVPQEVSADAARAWLESDLCAGDTVVVLREGASFQELDRICSQDRMVRFLVESGDDRYLSEAVRQVSVQSMLRNKVALYTTSRVRNLDNLNVDLLHDASVRMVSVYNVDYADPDVKSFVYAYRALFDAEPGSFAFHGYDTVRYFAHLCARYGNSWFGNIAEYAEDGLQMSFRFVDRGVGKINTGVRKSVYNKDFSVTCE